MRNNSRKVFFALIFILFFCTAYCQETAETTADQEQAPIEITDADTTAPSESTRHSDADMEKIATVKAMMEKGEADPYRDERASDVREPELLDLAMRAIFGLGISVALILLSYAVVKKFGKHTPLLAGMHMAKVVGKLHLAPGVALHFVKAADKMLLIGVTKNNVSLVTSFDSDHFEEIITDKDKGKPAKESPNDFDDLLRAKKELYDAKEGDPADVEASQLAALRNDIERLQEYLQETSNEPIE